MADAFVRSAKVWNSRATADPKVEGLLFAMWYSHSVWKYLCIRSWMFVHICTETNTIQCVSPERGNDVTSCRHCWTAKQICQLIFTPRCTSSFLLPAHSDISLGFMTWRSSSFFSPLLSHGSPLLLMFLFLLQSGSVASPPPLSLLPSLCNSSLIGWDHKYPPDASISPHSKRLNYMEINGVLEHGCR